MTADEHGLIWKYGVSCLFDSDVDSGHNVQFFIVFQTDQFGDVYGAPKGTW